MAGDSRGKFYPEAGDCTYMITFTATIMKKILIPFILAMICFGLQAQEAYTLTLMNGQEVPVYNFNDSSFTNLQFTFDKNFFKRERLNLRERRKAGDYFNTDITSPKAEKYPVVMVAGSRLRDEVFAVERPDGSEKIFYEFDEEQGNYLTVDAMRYFAVGQSDAFASKTGRSWLYTGLGLGAAAGLAARGSMLALLVPPLFALSTKIPTVSIPPRKMSNLAYQHNEDYARGFETQTRSRNLRQALKGSAVGVVAGLIVYSVLDNNR